ncbi:MAG: hypothetical protein HFE39_10090 [Clostridiales bacterium]|jgi:hypothetical protein|nr:hypothetical protein [Clostridiales bacterium]
MKKRVTLCIPVLCLLLFFGCSSSKGPPDIQVKCGTTVAPVHTGLNQWNGAVFDREDAVRALVQEGTPFPYCKLGATVRVEFPEGQAPDQAVLNDALYREDGTRKFDSRSDSTRTLEFTDGAAQWELTPHPSSAFSSEYIPCAVVLRGFRLICSWGDNQCEYAFVLSVPADYPPSQ